MDKSALRRDMRDRRRTVSAEDARTASQHLLRLAKRHHLLLRNQRIGFYLPLGEEIDLLPLMNAALWLHKACFLPVVPPRGARRMWFSRITDHPTWYQNRFGIYEHGSIQRVRAHKLDVLFMPLVAFDSEGNRLGMGGGFYDASLTYLRSRRAYRKPKLIGVAYDFQHVESLPYEPWDVTLDAVLTDRKLYRFRK
ncbi:MAG: 5-formyltetrahydrofolate cyclo-ligase [Burkholderiales bacterium]|nr:5-formyltetrahydrofolate cyclo-ligase [Burkholderiales bacterium]